MRIVGGTFKGRTLKAPDTGLTRPTSDRAREALFNILSSYLLKTDKNWTDIVFADIFAGSGAVGTEALSRGARKVFFVEKNKEAIACIRQNTKGITGAEILCTDAFDMPFSKTACDIIFTDAPYQTHFGEKVIESIEKKGWIKENTLVIIEVEKNEKPILPDGFVLKEERTYGKGKLIFCQKSV